MKIPLKTIVFGASAVLILAAAAFAQKGSTTVIRSRDLKGGKKVVRGYISNRLETNEHRFRVRAGQTLNVDFKPANGGAASVCVLSPNNKDFCGRRNYSLRAGAGGEYTILVDAKRDNFRYMLTVWIK